MNSRYAEDTKVSVSKSRQEIEWLVEHYGAHSFGSVRDGNNYVIAFKTENRCVRFVLTVPDENDKKYERDSAGRSRPKGGAHAAWKKECRSLWRSLALCIKAKLESVRSGITSFDEEFMAQIVDPTSNRTIGELVAPQLDDAYQNSQPIRLLEVS